MMFLDVRVHVEVGEEEGLAPVHIFAPDLDDVGALSAAGKKGTPAAAPTGDAPGAAAAASPTTAEATTPS